MPNHGKASCHRPPSSSVDGGAQRSKRQRTAIAEDSPLRSVRVLQRMWRRVWRYHSTRRLVEEYLTGGPTASHVKGISFESLVCMLRGQPVISLSKACLQRIHLLSTFRHGSPCKALVPQNVNVRVFLAGYMIAFRPTHVFESMGALEKQLLEVAAPLIHTFERILALVREKGSFSAVPHELTQDFPTMLFEYLKRFKAWKVPDEVKLTTRIKHALIALYQAEEHLPPDEPEDSKLKIEFRTQITRLRGKLQQIAGADALAEFEELRQKNPSAIVSGGAAGGGGVYAALPGRMSNEQLAHELLLDPLFQLDESGGCSVENPVFHRIRESFHQAFWDSLVDDLRLATPCYVRVLRVLAEIRDGIADLSGSRESSSISEVLDLDLIKQQMEDGAYNWEDCCRLIAAIVAIVKRVQAPKRDGETLSLWKPIEQAMHDAGKEGQARAFCKALEFLLDRVNAMRIDACNSRLRLIAPVIKDHGIDYERGKFQDKLNDGSLTLERTQAWIRLAMRREVAAKNVELDHLLEGRAWPFVHVHSMAMLSLVADQTTIKADVCPETLLFDVHRLGMLQREFQYVVAAVTIMVTATHALSATRDSGAMCEIGKLFVPETKVEIDLEPTIAEIGLILEKESSLSDEGRKSLLKSLVQCASPSDAVHQLLAQRIRTFWARIMKDGTPPSDLKFINAARVLVPRMAVSATKLMSLSNLNRTVHLPTYNKLMGEESLSLRAEA